jgi:hypothetical protein
MPTDETVLVLREYDDNTDGWEEISLLEAAIDLKNKPDDLILLNATVKNVRDVRRCAYDRYQLDWMRQHNRSISDLFDSVVDYAENADDNEAFSGKHVVSDLFANWLIDSGFNGSLWVCYEEFIESEYLDVCYMYDLLPERWDSYLEDYKRITGNQVGMLHITMMNYAGIYRRCILNVDSGEIYSLPSTTPGIGNELPDQTLWRKAEFELENGAIIELHKDSAGKWSAIPFLPSKD